jgi:peptide deformylase
LILKSNNIFLGSSTLLLGYDSLEGTMLVLFPDERLRQISAEADLSIDLQIIIHNMFAVMYQYGGVGLSAIQIGIPLRLVVADVGEGKEVYINPKIERLGGTYKLMNEGCLSFPGVQERVKRFTKTTISYTDMEGNKKTLNTGGFRAQMLQHEIEHLDGKLLGDKVP